MITVKLSVQVNNKVIGRKVNIADLSTLNTAVNNVLLPSISNALRPIKVDQ